MTIQPTQRITLRMNEIEAIMALSEGNHGAFGVCMELLQRGGDIDPNAAFGGLGSLLSLDSEGIYGCRIWMLYSDVCGRDLVKVIALLRASQLGNLSRQALNYAIDNRGSGVDVASELAFVRNRLPTFGHILPAQSGETGGTGSAPAIE